MSLLFLALSVAWFKWELLHQFHDF